MSNRVYGGRVPACVVRVAAMAVAAGVVALAAGGVADAQPPGDSCSPAAMMRAHAAAMTQMAERVADLSASCGLSMDQAMMMPGGMMSGGMMMSEGMMPGQ